MSFTSLAFFPFFAIYFFLSFALSQRKWLVLAAVASSIFYAYWDWRFLFLLYYVISVSWFCGRQIFLSNDERRRKLYVTISVVSCLLVLGVFKYFNFFTDSFVQMSAAFGLKFAPEFARVILPVGISFYTFHALSYTIDLYRRKLKRPADFLSLTVYLAFFPQLVAGPIVRAHRFLPQIDRGPIFSPRKIRLGLLLIAWGYFLKICVADSIGLFVDPVFAEPGNYASGNLLFAIIGYSFQIYGDFAGYSFIAIGLAKMQGFDFPANFLAPYFSKSFSEFWRRWHISLSSFLRDYLYIPLGGNRHGKFREYLNLFVTMFLGGLWHGASYNFVVWGVLHGLYLIVQRLWQDFVKSITGKAQLFKMPASLTWLRNGFKMLVVYAFVVLAWVFFRLHTFSSAMVFLKGIAAHEDLTVIRGQFIAVKVALLIVSVVVIDAIFIDRRRVVRLLHKPWACALSIAVLACAVELFGSFGGGAFIYFQF